MPEPPDANGTSPATAAVAFFNAGHEDSFGSRLRRARLAAGLSQEALAERARMSSDAVAALERGRRRFPRPQTVKALAAALGLTDEDRAALLAAAPRRPAPGESTTAGGWRRAGG